MRKLFTSLCILALGVSSLTGPVSANTNNCKKTIFAQNQITSEGSQNRNALAAETDKEKFDEQEPVFHYKVLNKKKKTIAITKIDFVGESLVIP